MGIYFYSKTCENCAGNHAIKKMQQLCKKYGIDFQERRTIFWKVWEKEAGDIMELNEGLELPFFYNSDTGSVMVGNSLTPLDTLEKWIKTNKDMTNENQ